MAKNSDHSAASLQKAGGASSGLFAEENEFDRRTLWRLGSWGAAAVAAVVVAVITNQSSLGWRRDQLAAAELVRQAQQMQAVARESQGETRRLASAIDTLNGDRDRLYARVTVLEQGLDSVTGALARQSVAPPPAQAIPSAGESPLSLPAVAATPTVAPVGSTVLAKVDPTAKPERPRPEAVTSDHGAAAPKPQAANPPTAPAAMPTAPLVASKSIMAPPDPGAPRLVEPEKASAKTEPNKTEPNKPELAKSEPAKSESIRSDPAKSEPIKAEVAKAEPARAEPPFTATDIASTAPKEPDGASPPAVPVQRTEFAVDVGSANSIGGLRALWRGLVKSNADLASLRPIIMVKESNTGLGMQLHLGAGPLTDAAAAAKICAALIESQRSCETAVFDGQRLALNADEPRAPARPAPSQHRRGYYPKHGKKEDPPAPPPAPKPEPSALSRLFNR
ncbi:hypothetical protein [Bradyrhizobium sp. NP1]|uniref:hypothetical protein n=1 Tax=Bradyrhizobium sp. NP1 TaxID=3049772 RepID=UPI0025A5DFD0|nr:hypothetical protein [Bradyrhizobium sp. NP1]WJR74849.1 hypothetical protein QOU61_18635 [Bradyrhizobium sp. NP1]